MQKEYVPQQVMCVTFTSISMSADIAGVRRSFVQTCSSRRPAAVLGVLVPPTLSSLPSLTSRFYSFRTLWRLCRWQGTRGPVGRRKFHA
jgi:hypothetical protein